MFLCKEKAGYFALAKNLHSRKIVSSGMVRYLCRSYSQRNQEVTLEKCSGLGCDTCATTEMLQKKNEIRSAFQPCRPSALPCFIAFD